MERTRGSASSREQKKLSHIERRGEQFKKRIANFQSRWNAAQAHMKETVLENDKSIGRILYHGDFDIGSYFLLKRELHDVVGDVAAFRKEDTLGRYTVAKTLSLEDHDDFPRKFRGLSLFDIEDMKLDPQTGRLSLPDIKRINRMFRQIPVKGFRPSPRRRFVLQHLILFAAKPWLDPSGRPHVPAGVERLHRNITAYFDYYVNLITDSSLNPWDDTKLLSTLGYTAPWLPKAVNLYLPARLGITSSSAMKLYKQKEVLGYPDARRAWKLYIKRLFMRDSVNIYRPGALPEDLHTYQFYNEAVDARAAQLLKSFYTQGSPSDEEQLITHAKAEALRESFIRSHHKNIAREIFRTKQQRIQYSPEKNDVLKNITVTAQNRRTLIFVLHLPDNIHLTLELDQEGRVYGIPPDLIKSVPHIEELLLIDVLRPLLKKYGDASVISEPLHLVGLPSPSEGETAGEEPSFAAAEKARPPRLRLIQSEPTPPEPNRPSVSRKFVSYSEEKINAILETTPRGGKHHEISSILEALRQFEQGQMRAKTVDAEAGIVRLQSDGYEIYLRRQGGNAFSLAGISELEKAALQRSDAAVSQKDTLKPAYVFSLVKQSSDGSGDTLTEFDTEDYIRRRSEKIAGSDVRMRQDLQNILSSLQDNPYGTETIILHGKTITVGYRTYRLRRLDPRRREDLDLKHEFSGRLRTVYAVIDDDENGHHIIALKGIYSHEEYDKEFGS